MCIDVTIGDHYCCRNRSPAPPGRGGELCAQNLFGAAGVATSDHSAGSSEGSSLSVARLGGQETGETSAVAVVVYAVVSSRGEH